MPDLESLRRLAEDGFFEIVQSTAIIENKLRIELVDGSYIDFWWSSQFSGRFAFHWERSHVDGTIYRHDNIPHPRWEAVSSFPKHFHLGDRRNVVESNLADVPGEAMVQFLTFARGLIT